jgi:lipopolysaccharide export system permease protein
LKIISRYVLREHLGPLVFAFTALTSLMLLNFISRQFGELVGKGLPWSVIGEFFLLSIPFTVALTVPMSVLVAVLYAYSRLASENEVTAFRANGVGPMRLVAPAIAGGVVMSVGLLVFNDQVLPRANHRLKSLQDDISQTKPTLLLKEQVINPIAEGKFYLKAGKIDNAHGRMKEVVIYDLGVPTARRTIYADSGLIEFAANKIDLDLKLFSGQMQEVPTDKPSQLSRLFYKQDRIRIRDVGKEFKQSQSDSSNKGDREMGVCEMQRRLWIQNTSLVAAERELDEARKNPGAPSTSYMARPQSTPEPRGIGWAYCTLIQKVVSVKEAHAADVQSAGLHPDTGTTKTPAAKPDTGTAPAPVVKADTGAKPPQDTSAKSAAEKPASPGTMMGIQNGRPVVVPPAGIPPVTAQPATQTPSAAAAPGAKDTAAMSQEEIAARAAAAMQQSAAAVKTVHDEVVDPRGKSARVMEAQLRVRIAEQARNRYAIEIHKKFSLAAACLIFCIVAPPIALRFPRGGVGLVIGVSLTVFALYYVGLIGGEALANKALVPPFWAMWGTNVIMTLVGVVLLARMGHEGNSGRGGGIREWLDNRRARREDRLAASTSTAAARAAA